MKTLEQNLTQYAAYHRDRRNIATHFAGIPMIVFAIVLALATVVIPVASVPVTAAALLCVVAGLYYLRLDLAFGLTMALVLFGLCAAASEITHRYGTGTSLAWAAGLFVAGWALQFLGHKYEGMKPAFVDDAMQLVIGPLFVCAESYFLLGGRAALRRHIEARVGPTVARRDGRPLPLAKPGTDPGFDSEAVFDAPERNRGLSPVFGSFGEFYPYYLSEHRNATCRKLHFAGSTLVLVLLAWTFAMQAWWLLWLVPVAGYGFAWVGHFAFEKNRPATFRHPLYSLVGDWVMYWQLLSGKIPFAERDPGAGESADSA